MGVLEVTIFKSRACCEIILLIVISLVIRLVECQIHYDNGSKEIFFRLNICAIRKQSFLKPLITFSRT